MSIARLVDCHIAPFTDDKIVHLFQIVEVVEAGVTENIFVVVICGHVNQLFYLLWIRVYVLDYTIRGGILHGLLVNVHRVA